MNPNAKSEGPDWSELLCQVGQKRDRQAFAKLFAHFGPLIKGFCLSQSQHGLPGEAAEELVQDVMLKVWLKSPDYDPAKAGASTWVYTVMRNCRIDMLRRQGRHYNNAEELEADELWDDSLDQLPLTHLEQARNRKNIHEAIEQLPEEQRFALKQVYMQGKTHAQLSEESGLPLGTVKSRVRIGLKKLHTVLGGRV